MNKNELIDDEKLPSEEETAKMNEAYNKEKVEKNLLSIASFLNGSKCNNHNICTCDFDNIARCYFLEKDIVTSLNFLFMKARQPATKNSIRCITRIKEKVIAELLSIYIKGTGNAINYAPNIIDRPTYAGLYNEINYMQMTLLARLDDIPCIPQIIMSEHTATLILYSIKP